MCSAPPAHATMDNVGLIRYMKAKNIKMDTLSAINQDYAWGQGKPRPTSSPPQDSLSQRKTRDRPAAEIRARGNTAPKFPPWLAPAPTWSIPACGAAICRRSFCNPCRAAWQNASNWWFSAADHVLPPLGDKMPDGVIIGARGAYGLMSQKSPLNDWFFKGYESVNNVYPVQAAYRIAQSILGLKAAAERRWRRTAARNLPPTNWLRR